eukprot:TRINITY_DN16576_c0_g1_i1.p1 TRINITY_DN16576_c0_g1~~TRINITY_DN16576_c0_g1_i1.p1  ORF type:complete len:546 (+),score=131.65 TRINITY_DN16576_c0_g1_i1:56-1639(+)
MHAALLALLAASPPAARREVSVASEFVRTVSSVAEGMMNMQWASAGDHSAESLAEKLLREASSVVRKPAPPRKPRHTDKAPDTAQWHRSPGRAELHPVGTDKATGGGSAAAVGGGKARRRRARTLQTDEDEDDGNPRDDDASRSFQAGLGQQSLGVLTEEYCAGGVILHVADSGVQCPTASGNVTITTEQWKSLPATARAACTVPGTRTVRIDYDKSERVADGPWNTSFCVCPKDSVVKPGVRHPLLVTCETRILHCDTTLLRPDPRNCGRRVWSLDWMQPCHWYTTSDTAVLEFRVNCTLADDADAGQPLDPDADEMFPGSPPTGGVSVAREGGLSVPSVVLPGGLILASRSTAPSTFRYYATGRNGEFGLHEHHWLLRAYHSNGSTQPMYSVSAKLYDFNRVSDDMYRVNFPFTQMEDGLLTGEKTFTHSIDFATVPPRYFIGGRVFAEAGMLFSANHTLKVLFDFSDYSVSPKGTSQADTFKTAEIVLGVLFGLVVIVTFFTYRCLERQQEDLVRRREEHEHLD